MRALRYWVPLLPLALSGCVATVGPQFSQEIAASFAQQPMRRLETPHAEIYYPDGKRQTAERIAARLGQCVDDLREHTRAKGDEKRKVLLFLTTADFNNAYVSPEVVGNRQHMVVPENLSIELFNLFDLGLTDVGDVGCHEAVHYVQLDQTTGLWSVLNLLTGGLFQPNAFTESWFLEGLATYYEGKLHRSTGRPHSPIWNGMYEAGIASRGGEVRTGDLSPENRDLIPFGGNYVAGQHFVDFLARAYGEEKLWQLVAMQGDSILSPFGVTLRFKAVYGKSIGALYAEYQKEASNRFVPRERPSNQEIVASEVGYFARLAGSPEDGATAVITSQREQVGQLVVRERDGRIRFARSLTEFIPPRRWLALSSSLVSGMSFTADGRRLFELDAKTGSVIRIHDGFGRGMGGSVHPEGRSYLFVQLEGDTSHLASLDLASGKVTRLASYEGGRSLGPPAYSPNARRVLFPRRTPAGFDLYLFDESGEARALTEDGRFNYSPRWLDDDHAVFIREHDGRAQLHRVNVTTGEISRISDAPYVAFDPAPIGQGQIAFLNREGWSWSLDAVPAQPPDASPLPTEVIPAPDIAAVPPVEVLSDEPYSHTDHLFLPVFRLPLVYVLPNTEGQWTEIYASAALSGRDRLGLHNWALNVTWDNMTNEPSVSAAYGSSLLAPWYFELGAARQIGSGTIAGAPDDVRVRIRENSAYVFASRSFWTTPVAFGLDYIDRRETLPGLLDRWIRLVGPSVGTTWFAGEGTPYAGTRRGIGLSLGGSLYPAMLGSGSFLGDITLGDVRAELFGFVPLPGLSRQSFRFRVAGRRLPGAPPGLLQVGGLSSASVIGTWNSQPSAAGPEYFLPSGFSFTEPVRGFEDTAIYTTGAAIAGVRWRYPWVIDRGATSTFYVLPSFFLSQIDFELFAEGAMTGRPVDAFANPIDVPTTFGAAGAALFIRSTLGGTVPLSLGYQFAVRSTLPPAHFWFFGLQ